MSAWLYDLGTWSFRHRKLVIWLWLGLAGVLAALGFSLRSPYNDQFEIPGSDSAAAFDRLHMTFPSGASLTATAVVVAPDGLTIAELEPQITQGIEDIERLNLVESVASPFNEYLKGAISDDGRVAMIRINLDLPTTATDAQRAELTAAGERMQELLPQGSRVVMGGRAFNYDVPQLGITEVVGVLIALVVLYIMLGSIISAVLPIFSAILGVVTSMGLLLLGTNITNVNSVVPLMGVMLGLAVGMDYALFILMRHREQLKAGMPPLESAGKAIGTAGSAVLFAATTNVIALLGLSVVGIPFLTIMGVYAALTVAVTVALALTLMPAFMGVLGRRMMPKPKRRGRAARAASKQLPATDEFGETRPPRERRGVFERWVQFTTSHPIVTTVVVVAGLVVLAIPGLRMQLSLPNSADHGVNAPDRIAYDLIEKHFGPGYNTPLIVTAEIISSTDPLGLIDDLVADVRELDNIKLIALAVPNKNADTALIQIIPYTSQYDPATAKLVDDLRELVDTWPERHGIEGAVTGITAVQLDVNQRIAAAALPFGTLVVGLSLLVLVAVFRSVWIAVKTTLGFLLSIGAAFGATTLVFNDGWFNELINLERPTSVISFLPIILMGVLFGLSMDYEAFLVSRMREEYVHGKPHLDAIRDGFRASGPVIIALALIMFTVFVSFVPTEMMSLKALAFASAVGVLVDAVLVRMTLVPAVLTLIGDRAWRLPSWLERYVPVVDVEGEVLTRKLRLADWPGDGSVVHVEQLRVAGIVAELDLVMYPGQVVGIVGQVGARTGAALALTGRLPISSGRARVAGELLPDAEAAVRRRTTYLDVANSSNAARALDRVRHVTHRVIVLDSLERITTAAEREALAEIIAHTRQNADRAVLCCATSAELLQELALDRVVEVVGETAVRSES